MDLIYAFDSEKFHLGPLCKRGHQWPGTKESLRRKDGKCRQCVKERYQANIENERCKARERMAARDYVPYCERSESQKESIRAYKRKKRKALKDAGLTCRGTEYKIKRRNEAQKCEDAIRNAGKLPSVALLVKQAQTEYWRNHPDEKQAHDRWWAQHSWWLRYQANPSLRLYHREKSKRRKAEARGQTPVQISVAAIRSRFALFDNCCAYCGVEGDMQIEHVMPISKGGPHDPGNIVPACPCCNASKSTNTMEQWYLEQPFFCEIRLQRIKRATGNTAALQLPLALP